MKDAHHNPELIQISGGLQAAKHPVQFGTFFFLDQTSHRNIIASVKATSHLPR
jgi:hypothetical protein